jgi:outer membrane protein assembly factor BamB
MAICFLLCILTVSVLGNVVLADDWPMFHHDADHTGYTTSNGPVTNSTLWTFTTINDVESGVAVANGYVYVPCGNILNWATNNMVYCLNAQTDALVWNFTPGGYVFTPAVANGYVYLGSYYSVASPNDGYLYCLNATTGNLVWNYGAGAFNDVYAPIVANGYVGTSGGELLCINATTGVLAWEFATSGAAYDPSVSGSYVYIGCNSGTVYCLNALTGTSVWNYTANGGEEDAPVVYNGNVYFGSSGPFVDNFNVTCLNAQTGTFVWNFTIAAGEFGTIAVANGNVYVPTLNHDLYCLNAQTGTQVWEDMLGGTVESSPAVTANGYVYVGCDDYNVYCLDAQTGALVWQYATRGSVSSSPAIVNGVLYIGSDDQNVYAFGTTQALQSATLSIDTSAQSIAAGSLLTISGTLTPAQSGTVTIYESINGSAWGFYTPNEATLSGGAYSLKLRPEDEGTYQFYANWPGNSQYTAASSSIVTVTVGVVPEFPEPLILAMFMLVILLTIAIYKKRNNHS